MRKIPLYLICSAIGVFLWQSFDLATYRLHQKSPISQSIAVPEKQVFLEDVTVMNSPQKETWIIDALRGAKNEIRIAVYMLTVPSLMEELAQAKKRGVKVKVLLEKHPYNATAINQAAVRYFQNNDIDFHETDDKYFSFMHAKYVIIDDKWMISTANWTKSSFSTNREFFMLGQDQKILNSLKEIFESDFGGVVGSSNDDRLIVGPTNARERIINFMNSSKKLIQIYMPNISDPEMILEIQKKCQQNIHVMILRNENKEEKEQADGMTQKGCPDIRIMKNPTLHAKIILVDKTQGFVGSFNFTKNSLENNRELGIFVYGKSVEYIVNKFQSDWENSIAF